MICLSDNDIVLKLACCDLLNETLDVLGVRREEVFVLPTARHVLLKPLKAPEKGRARLGDAVFQRVTLFLDSVQVIEAAPSPQEMLLFDDIVGIDSGEAVLFATTAHFPEFILATSDKNSLRALSSTAACEPICRRLAGKVICFEQLILRLIDRLGFNPIRDKVVPARDCDTALRAVFGSGLDAAEENVRTGLASYVNHLRGQTGALLVG
jgi:hypothetical protein